MSNYPNDIRMYDDDPHSPFYEEWRCPSCGGYEGNVTCNEDTCEREDEDG